MGRWAVPWPLIINEGGVMKREDVYKLIDGEREYQKKRHEKHIVPHRDEDHSIADWVIYMEEHIARAKLEIYNLTFERAMAEVRKVTALGVACMEHNETKPRSL